MRIIYKKRHIRFRWLIITLLVLFAVVSLYHLVVSGSLMSAKLASVENFAADTSEERPLLKTVASPGSVEENGSVQGSDGEAVPRAMMASAPAVEPVRERKVSVLRSALESPLYYAILLVVSIVFLSYFLIFVEGHPLDQEMFKTLSSDTRSQILDMVAEHEKRGKEITLTDISEKMKISLPGAKQHVDLLLKNGLVRVADTHGKWKMFALTEKAKDLMRAR